MLLRSRSTLYSFFTLLIIISCSDKKEIQQTGSALNLLEYTVQQSLPHDTKAFTQGLTIHQGKLYESTGQQNSWIGLVNIATGVAEKKVVLPTKYFGEGITILNNKLYQLTWQDSIGFVYDLKSFKKLQEFKYKSEGWGITHDNVNLILSDGSSRLFFLDTLTFGVTRTLNVTYNGKAVTSLNELEYVEGKIFANIWQSNLIAKINSSTGVIEGFLDLSSLAKQARMLNPSQDVLNGIAWHSGTQSLLVTGKYWPTIFVLKLSTQSTP